MSEPTMRSSQRDGVFAILFDLLFSLIFLSVIGVLFVAFCVLLGKYELLVLAYVLLTAAVVRPMIPEQRMEKLKRMAVIGEGLKIFTHLESYYLQYPPRSIFFYLFFPVTGIFSFFFSKERGRRELKAHFVLVQWILVLLLIQGFASYARFYQHFPWRFASAWLYMELLSVYFLCNFFAIPAATTPIRLSVTGRRLRLMLVSFLAIVIMSGFLFAYKRGVRYDNLIPINIAMDRRMDALKQRVQLNYLRAKQGLPPILARKIAGRPNTEEFFTHFQDISEMYLRHLAPRILDFHKKHYFALSRKTHEDFIAQLNSEFQAALQRIAAFGEHEQIFLTFTQEPGDIWGMILMPFRENLFYAFKIVQNAPPQPMTTLRPQEQATVHFYRRWEDMPVAERNGFVGRWERGRFRFAAEKRMARVIVDTMRDLSRRTAPTEPEPAEEEPALAKKDEEAPKSAKKSAKKTDEELKPSSAMERRKQESEGSKSSDDAPSAAMPKTTEPPAPPSPVPVVAMPPSPPPPPRADMPSPRPKIHRQERRVRRLRISAKEKDYYSSRARRTVARYRARRAKKPTPSGRAAPSEAMPSAPSQASTPSQVPAPSTPLRDSKEVPQHFDAPSTVKPERQGIAPQSGNAIAKKQAPAAPPSRIVFQAEPSHKSRQRRYRPARRVRRILRPGFGGRGRKAFPSIEASERKLPSVVPETFHAHKQMPKARSYQNYAFAMIQQHCQRIYNAHTHIVKQLQAARLAPKAETQAFSHASFLAAHWEPAWSESLTLLNLPLRLAPLRPGLPKDLVRFTNLSEQIQQFLTTDCLSLRLSSVLRQITPQPIDTPENAPDAVFQADKNKIKNALFQIAWLLNLVKKQAAFLEDTANRLSAQWGPIQHQRRFFLLYNETLRQLHLERALSAKLLYDHFGDTPPLPPLWWADLYEYFLRLLLFLFQLTMPIHILLILYCHIRLREPAEQATRIH